MTTSRRRKVTVSVVCPDVEGRAVLADDPTIPNDNPILQEIDNYLEGTAADDGEVEDSD
ncbi:hypothetical protein TIFTF001_027473 [Ficus carica]|uniref:Uncharacterized protein n=1 Tax=Ficus carica TaxID=3494 RepID=A0AA88DNE7_FICCA|nr:hypothetical protein TIFTF001_027473 [Ficus carica]